MKPRLLLVARERYRIPLSGSLRRKFAALERRFEVRVVASAAVAEQPGDDRFQLARPLPALDGPAFYAALPARIARELRAFRPDAVLVQGTHETAAALVGRRLAGVDAPVILDLHGNWRAATRLYGSVLRRTLDPLGDVLSRFAVAHADAIRTISGYTTGLVRELGRQPAAEFPAYVDVVSFLDRPPAPLPGRPLALFVGALEPYKNVDGLADAWRLAAPQLAGAKLWIVGRGHQVAHVRRLVADLPEQTAWTPRLSAREVAGALDRSTALVLPSRSEGLPRVVIEAFCRGRPVLGSWAGGIPDLVEHGSNGLLSDSGDIEAIAGNLVLALSDRALAERLADGARASARAWVSTPEEFARRLAELVGRACARTAAAG